MLSILMVCGNGCGSSLVCQMAVEAVLKELGVQAKVDHSDMLSAAFFLFSFPIQKPPPTKYRRGNCLRCVMLLSAKTPDYIFSRSFRSTPFSPILMISTFTLSPILRTSST